MSNDTVTLLTAEEAKKLTMLLDNRLFEDELFNSLRVIRSRASQGYRVAVVGALTVSVEEKLRDLGYQVLPQGDSETKVQW